MQKAKFNPETRVARILKVKDAPTVYCYDGEVDSALSVLRRKVATLGTYRILKNRRRYPSVSARKREKLRRSIDRLKRRAKRRW